MIVGIIRKKKLKNIIIYVVKKMQDKVKINRKYLQKIIFLINYYNPETGELTTKNKILKNVKYFVYCYGPYSFEVSEVINELLNEGKLIEDNGIIRLKNNIKEPKLGKKVRERVYKILKRFGNLSGKELEILSLELLGIKDKKEEFYGFPIDVIIEGKF